MLGVSVGFGWCYVARRAAGRCRAGVATRIRWQAVAAAMGSRADARDGGGPEESGSPRVAGTRGICQTCCSRNHPLAAQGKEHLYMTIWLQIK